MVSLQYLESNEIIKPQEFRHEVSDIIFQNHYKITYHLEMYLFYISL